MPNWLEKILDKADDPLQALGHEIESRFQELERKVRIAVETTILRETIRFELSRLITLDPENKANYEDALLMLK